MREGGRICRQLLFSQGNIYIFPKRTQAVRHKIYKASASCSSVPDIVKCLSVPAEWLSKSVREYELRHGITSQTSA